MTSREQELAAVTERERREEIEGDAWITVADDIMTGRAPGLLRVFTARGIPLDKQSILAEMHSTAGRRAAGGFHLMKVDGQVIELGEELESAIEEALPAATLAAEHAAEEKYLAELAAKPGDPEWSFERAWAERNELSGKVGTRPEDPQVLLDRLTKEHAATCATLTRWEQAAARLPAGHRGILDTQLAQASGERDHLTEQVTDARAVVEDGSDPRVQACAQWDLEHGRDQERITELSAACVEHINALSQRDWTVPPMPTGVVEQALYLRVHGPYAERVAWAEHNVGREEQAGVDTRDAYREQMMELAFSVSRGGYTEEVAEEAEAIAARWDRGIRMGS